MEELTPQNIANLASAMEEGEIVRSWLQHPGFKIFRSWIEKKIEDKRSSWLRCPSPVEAEAMRVKASVYVEVMDELKKFIISGETAKKLLAQHKEETDSIAPETDKA